MNVTLHPTDEIVVVNDVPCRVWAGKADDGSDVVGLVAMMAAGEFAPTGKIVELNAIPPHQQGVRS